VISSLFGSILAINRKKREKEQVKFSSRVGYPSGLAIKRASYAEYHLAIIMVSFSEIKSLQIPLFRRGTMHFSSKRLPKIPL
jgi:hypothetical protein